MKSKTEVAREIISHGGCLYVNDIDCDLCPFSSGCDDPCFSVELSKNYLSKKEKPMKVKSTNGTEIELTEKVLIELADIMIERGVFKEEKPSYPYVGVSTTVDMKVLFIGKNIGFMVSGSYKPERIGIISYDWLEEMFKPFNGTITYKNGKPVKTEVSK